MKLNKFKSYFLSFFILIVIFFNYLNFVGFKEVKDDNVDYLKYTLNFAIHDKQSMSLHQDQNIIFDDERSPGYPFLNSIFLKGDKNKLLEKNLNCFLFGEDDFCKKIIIKLQKINFILYTLIVFSILIITYKIIKNIFFALLISLFFSLNTFFVTNISNINPEIISTLIILWLSYSSYIFYKNENYQSQILLVIFSSIIYFFKPAFIFYLLFLLLINIFLDLKYNKTLQKNNLKIILIFIISISPILFLKFTTFNEVKKITKTSDVIIKIKERYYEKYSPYKNQNIMRDSNNHDNFLPDNTGGEVLLARAVYSFIKWSEIPPLIISFLPVVNNYLLDNIYEHQEIERIKPGASFEGRNRNYFLIYRKFISEDYLLNNGYDLKKINTLQKSSIIYFSSTLKQLVLTPIFAFRGILAATNFNDLNDRFSDPLITKLYKSLAIMTFFAQFFGLLFLLYYFVKFIFNDINIKYVYLIMVPTYSIVFHSLLTHYIPRYSQPLMATAYVFLGILLYELIYKKN